jgi:hypothetical protein
MSSNTPKIYIEQLVLSITYRKILNSIQILSSLLIQL